jgi:hypothetical protein
MSETKFISPIDSDNLEVVGNVQKVDEFIRFVNWASTPRQFRKIKTQKDFADSIGVSQDTLTDWKKHPSFLRFMRLAIQQWCQERMPDAIGGLYEKVCSKANAKDVELFLKLAGLSNNTNNK